jgi:hypothetical protein
MQAVPGDAASTNVNHEQQQQQQRPHRVIAKAGIVISKTTSQLGDNSGSSSASYQSEFVVTILTRLVGETGNWLLYMAKTRVLQWRLEKLGIRSEIKYQVKQTKNKKCSACIDFIATCFPHLSHIDFDNVKLSHPNFLKRATAKRKVWFDENGMTDGTKIDISLDTSADEEDDRLLQLQQLITRDNNSGKPPHYDPSIRNISVPFIYVDDFAQPRDYNEYYHELRDYLQYDDDVCCKDALLPGPDVSVFVSFKKKKRLSMAVSSSFLPLVVVWSLENVQSFLLTHILPSSRPSYSCIYTQHFRGYRAEESLEESKLKGREELSPNKVATELFANSRKADDFHLAILSRLDNTSPLVQEYVVAFQQQQNTSTAQTQIEVIHQAPFRKDFCYLRHARKELVGMGYSTFVRIASFLVKYNPKVRLYCLDSPDTKRLEQQCRHYDFVDHPHLLALYSDEVYRSEEWKRN